MDIQAEKIELAKLILSTNDTGLINQIKSLFKSKEEDWMEELPAIVKQGINESIEQVNRGEFISYDEVKKIEAISEIENPISEIPTIRLSLPANPFPNNA